MRHGRKSRSQRFDGYKRHVLKDLDIGVVRAVGITPANVPEAAVTDDLATDLEPQNVKLEELHIDRAYLSSQMVKQRPEDVKIVCKAWPVRNGKHFSKSAFILDWEQGILHCLNSTGIIAVGIALGKSGFICPHYWLLLHVYSNPQPIAKMQVCPELNQFLVMSMTYGYDFFPVPRSPVANDVNVKNCNKTYHK